MSELSQTATAIRMRRYNWRRKEGAVFVSGDVLPGTIETLIDAGFLEAWDAKDPENIWTALIMAADDGWAQE